MRYLIALLLCLGLVGCSPTYNKNVDILKKKPFRNGTYKLKQEDVVGISSGIDLLGVIPLVNNSYDSAMIDLNSKIDRGPKDMAIVNVRVTRIKNNFLLFSRPETIITADVIELRR